MTTDTPEVRIIDWEARGHYVQIEGRAGEPLIDLRGLGSAKGGNWAIVPRSPGTILTADIYNADRQALVDHATPIDIDDYSSSLAEMGAETNPHPGGSPFPATSLAGELERIRYVIHMLNPAAPAWYHVASQGLGLPNGLTLPNGLPLRGVRTDGTTTDLIMLGGDNSLYIGWNLPDDRQIVLNEDVLIDGGWRTTGAVNEMVKNSQLKWGDVVGLAVDTNNTLYLGDALVPIQILRAASSINLNAPTITMNGNAGIGGTLTVGGAITAGNGLAEVFAKNTAKAWARFRTGPSAQDLGQWGFASIVGVATGTLRFTLARAITPVIQATAEAGGVVLHCLVQPINATVFDVVLLDTGNVATHGIVHVTVFGS